MGDGLGRACRRARLPKVCDAHRDAATGGASGEAGLGSEAAGRWAGGLARGGRGRGLREAGTTLQAHQTPSTRHAAQPQHRARGRCADLVHEDGIEPPTDRV
jgi:hypothetical protein